MLYSLRKYNNNKKPHPITHCSPKRFAPKVSGICSGIYPPSKFGGNLNQPTNKQLDMGENITATLR